MREVTCMDVLLIVAVLIVFVVFVAGVRWWMWRPMVRRRVFVQLDSGDALAGIVMSHRARFMVLADVTIHSHDQGAVTSRDADGTIVVDRARVLWVQVA